MMQLLGPINNPWCRLGEPSFIQQFLNRSHSTFPHTSIHHLWFRWYYKNHGF